MLWPGVTGYLITIGTRLINWNYKYLQRFLIILTSSSFFIASSGCLKTFFSFTLYGAHLSYPLLLATFLVIYSVYGLNKITDTEEDQLNTPERSDIISNHIKLFKYITAACYFLAVIIGLMYGWEVLIILLFPLMAGIIYSIRIHSKIPRLKDLFAVKSLIVALSWSVGNVFLPIVDMNPELMVMILLFFFFFVKSLINTVLFDLSDVEGDEKIGARTIPVVMGVISSIKILLVLNTTLIIFFYISMLWGFFQAFIIPLVFCIIYGYGYILYFSQRKNRLKMELMVDGEWILIFFIIIIKMGLGH